VDLFVANTIIFPTLAMSFEACSSSPTPTELN